MAGHETDLIIVGGGPAGCAAAVMAASLGLRSTLIERESLYHKLTRISDITNVLGDLRTGTELATRITADVAAAPHCELIVGQSVDQLRAFEDHVTATLTDGRLVTAPHAVVATGVGPLAITDVDWIDGDTEAAFPAVWQVGAAELQGREHLVLGADRPIGTVLRTFSDLDTKLLVMYPAAEQYKADEVRHDPRVTLLPVQHLTLLRDQRGGLHARVQTDGSGERSFTADHVLLNLGSKPVVPHGDVHTDGAGYCPPGLQHDRVIVAGDVRAARYQRIMTALGSGAEAALRAFYEQRGVI